MSRSFRALGRFRSVTGCRALRGEETEGLELSVTRDTTRTLVARVAPVVAASFGRTRATVATAAPVSLDRGAT